MKKVFLSALIFHLTWVFISCNSVSKKVNFTPSLNTRKECTISVVGYKDEFEVLQQIANDFKEFYPNVEIVYTCLQNNNTDIRNRFKTSKEIDIFMSPNLDSFISSDEIFINNSLDLNTIGIDFTYFNVSFLSYFTYDDKLLSLPLFPENYGMMVNEDIFNSVGLSIPSNISELVDTVLQFSKNGYSSPILANQKTYGLCFMPIYIDLINADCDVEEAFTEAITCAHNFTWLGGIHSDSYNISDNPRDIINRFFMGDIPIALISLSDYSLTSKMKLESSDYKSHRFDFSYAASPFCFDKNSAYFEKENFIALNIFKDSKNLDYACEFMRFVSLEDNIRKISELKNNCGVLYEKGKSNFSYFNNLQKKYVLDNSGLKEYLGIVGLRAFKFSEYWNKSSWTEFKKSL